MCWHGGLASEVGRGRGDARWVPLVQCCSPAPAPGSLGPRVSGAGGRRAWSQGAGVWTATRELSEAAGCLPEERG